MIIKAEIINQPLSGDMQERIFYFDSNWNSHNWTFVKFYKDDRLVWCGHFRGSANCVEVSHTYQTVIVLTSDYLIQMDACTEEIIAFEDSFQYRNLTLSPDESFIIVDYMNVVKFTNNINQKTLIECPIEMDFIEFKKWNENKLEFTCQEFFYWEKNYLMTYDHKSNLIEIKKLIK